MPTFLAEHSKQTAAHASVDTKTAESRNLVAKMPHSPFSVSPGIDHIVEATGKTNSDGFMVEVAPPEHWAQELMTATVELKRLRDPIWLLNGLSVFYKLLLTI